VEDEPITLTIFTRWSGTAVYFYVAEQETIKDFLYGSLEGITEKSISEALDYLEELCSKTFEKPCRLIPKEVHYINTNHYSETFSVEDADIGEDIGEGPLVA